MTHYETLGVSSKASDEDIRREYHNAMKSLHPDASPETSGAALEAQSLADVQEAYDALKTPEKRSAYDARLLALAPKCMRCKGTKLMQKRVGWSLEDVTCTECGGTGRRM
jgi:DnaJ-class molecular chaperone